MKNIISLLGFVVIFVFSFAAIAQPQESRLPRPNAEASLSREFDVKSSLETVTKWMENNKSDLYDASGIQVLKDLGNGRLKFSRRTRRGEFVWVVEEKIERTETKVIYKSSLVESIQGGIIYSDTITTVQKLPKGTNIKIETSSGVKNPNVTSGEMQVDIKTHLHKIEKTITRGVR